MDMSYLVIFLHSQRILLVQDYSSFGILDQKTFNVGHRIVVYLMTKKFKNFCHLRLLFDMVDGTRPSGRQFHTVKSKK